MCHAKNFLPQILYFAEQDYPILTFHYRGTFETPTKEPIDFKTIKQDILDLIESYFPEKKIILIGHSMGALLSMSFAQDHEELLSKMILLAPPYDIPQILLSQKAMSSKLYLEKLGKQLPKIKIDPKNLAQKAWDLVLKTILTTDLIYKIGFQTSRVPRKVAEEYFHDFFSCGPEAWSLYFNAIYSEDLSRIHHIQIPTLVIAGAKDPLVPFSLQKKVFETLKNSEFFVCLEGKHLLQIEFFQEINHHIEFFLKKSS